MKIFYSYYYDIWIIQITFLIILLRLFHVSYQEPGIVYESFTLDKNNTSKRKDERSEFNIPFLKEQYFIINFL